MVMIDTSAKPANGAPRLNITLADFDLVRRLGDGSYSSVILAKHKTTGQNFALKVIDKHHIIRHNAVHQVQLERSLLDKLSYEGIVTLYFTFQDAISLYMGLEYCCNGELYDQIRLQGSLPESSVKFYAAEVVLILEHLRQQGIVHRDLKPENLLLTTDGHLKLIDFGSAKDLSKAPAGPNTEITKPPPPPTSEAADEADTTIDSESPNKNPETNNNSIKHAASESPTEHQEETSRAEPLTRKPFTSKRANSLVGTADYVSPEVLENTKVGPAADLWALGCILYQMLTGKAPFKSNSEYLTFQKIVGLEYQPLSPDKFSNEVIDLVESLLKVNPKERLGCDDIEEIKSHPFFKDVDWKSIRRSTAPEIVPRDDNDSIGSNASSFDWELQSLAAALPKLTSSMKFRNSIEID